MSTCSPLAFVPPVRQVGGGIVAARAYDGFGCPQQLRRQRLIIQQIEISHIYQHQSRLVIFVHSEVETRLVFDKDTAPCHILDQT